MSFDCLYGTQRAINERIDGIANDIRQSEERTKKLLDTQMQELRALMTNRHSSYWDTMYRLLICHV